MTKGSILRALVAGVFVAAMAGPVCAAERFALVVTGAPGAPQYAERYAEWRTSLVRVLTEQFAYPVDHVLTLVEGDGEEARPPTREAVRAVMTDLARRVGKDDVLLVLLIGHGTAGDEDAKFNLVGPDLTADEWAGLIKPIGGRVVFVNGSSASFEFLERLAGRGRIVITATDSAAQQFATVFPEFFVQALGTAGADLDRNGRLSVWEAFEFASAGVKGWFEEQGRLATERPLLDDNGDGMGREAGADGPDGALARTTYLQPDAPVPSGGGDVAALLKRRADLAARIERHRAAKADLPPDQYERELEALLVELARLDRAIRSRS